MSFDAGSRGRVPSLIASDLDGTLLRSDGSISSRTRAALGRAARAGIMIVLVTARPPRRMRAAVAGLDVDALAICGNGALTYDLAREAVVEQSRLAADLANEIVAALRARLPEICFAVEVGLRFGQEPAYARHRASYVETEAPEYGDAAALCADGVTKLIARHPELDREQLLWHARDLIGERAVITHSGAEFVEIMAPGVTKAQALARQCAVRGIARETVVAFGDMPNDIPMLQWAGHGVAVANAHPEVLAACDEITAGHDEDGVALVVERLLDGRG